MLDFILSSFITTVAPITISSLEEIFSTGVTSNCPFVVRVGIPTTSFVASLVPFTKIAMCSPLKVEDKNDQSSVIVLVDSTLVHFIPSNTENFAVFSDCMLLLIVKENDLSLLTTVNSEDPEENSGFTQAVTVKPSTSSVTVTFWI